MAKQDVNVLIRARDEASKKFGMIGRSAMSMGQMIRRAAGLAGVYFGTRAIVNTMRESLALYSKQIEAEIKLQQAYIATGGAVGLATDEMKKYAAELQKVTRFGDEVTIEGMSLLMTFKNIQGDAFKRTTELAMDLNTAMGKGTGSLKETMLQLGKALNDPILGLTQLRRVGVSFTDAQADQIRQLVKTNDLLGAQTIMMDELTSQFGGQARAAVNSYAGAVERMRNAVGDLKERIGQALTPTMQRFADNMKVWAERNADTMYRWVATGISYVELITDSFKSLIAYLRTDFKSAIEWVWDAFLRVMKQAVHSAIDLAIAAGKGIARGIKIGMDATGGRERRISAEAERIYFERGGPSKKSGIRRTPSDAALFNEALEEAFVREREKTTESLIGSTLRLMAGEWEKTMADLRKSMPDELGKSVDAAMEKHRQRLEAIAAGQYGRPEMPGAGAGLLPFGGGAAGGLGGLGGVAAVESRFLTGGGIKDPTEGMTEWERRTWELEQRRERRDKEAMTYFKHLEYLKDMGSRHAADRLELKPARFK